jgi:Fucose permease
MSSSTDTKHISPAGDAQADIAPTDSTASTPPASALKDLLDTASNAAPEAKLRSKIVEDTATPSADHPHAERWITIAASALMCMVGLNSGWVGPSLESIAKAQGVPLANAGSLVSVYFVGCVVTIVVGQWILEKFGGRNSLRLAAVGMLAGLAMIASGAGFIITWLGSFILGLGVGISSIASNICILAIAPGHAASRLNRLHLFFGIGALIGPFVAWAGQQTTWSYQATYAFGVLYTAVVGVILMKTPNISISVNDKKKAKSSTDDSLQQTSTPHRSVFREPLLWLFSAILCLYVGIESGAGAWLFTFVEKEFQLSAGASAIAMSCLWGGLTLGRMSGVPLTRRFRPELITIVAMLISTTALAILLLASNLSDMALLVVAMLGFGFGPVFPTIIGGATTKFPAEKGTVTTTLITAGFIGGIIGPWTIGAVFEKIGLQQGMTMLLATSLAMSVLYAASAHKSKRA